MNEETRKTAQLILSEIAKSRNYSDTTAPHELFLACETIISGLAYLIGPKADLETKYRELIVKFMDEGDSHAKSEAKGKASKEYADYRKLEGIYEIGNQQILLLKKFKIDLQGEYNRA